MRQEKTLKVVGNFNITEPPSCVLSLMNNNVKAYTWTCYDFSDGGEAKCENLACRFQTEEAAKAFQKQFEAAQ